MALASSQTPAPAVASASLSGTLPFGLPLLLYGVRLWAAVCLALYVAFSLQLQNPSWAGTTAAIVCQPVLGASLRKGWFRMIGTVVGAVAGVVLTACFPQSRAGFLLALAFWAATCAFLASLLRNFASYAAALAGYTAAVIAGDELGAVGGANGEAFTLAVTRATEICLGIVCAGVVLASTDLGGARRRLSEALAGLAADAASGLSAAFRLTGTAAHQEARGVRRELARRASGLSVTAEQAAGEMAGAPVRPRALQGAVDGVFRTLSAWRTVALHLERQPGTETAAALRDLPDIARRLRADGDAVAARASALAAARRLVALPAASPSARLVADRAALGLLGIANALSGVILLGPRRVHVRLPRAARWQVPDALPAVINAWRAFLTVGAAEILWIATAWPSGATAMVFAAVTVILFAPREEAAFGMAWDFLLGNVATACLAAAVAFAVLPGQPTFAGFCISIGLVLVPAGALSAQAWRQPLFVAVAANFIPLLAPSNPETYDPAQFYNTAPALVAGVGMAALAMRLIPPLPPDLRARRLLALTLRDLRRLATRRLRPGAARAWESRVYGRLAAMPDAAAPIQRARLATALSVGLEIVRLRRVARRFGVRRDLEAALQAVAAGDTARAADAFARFDHALAAIPDTEPGGRLRLRARGAVCAITEALDWHSAYFDAEMSA